MLALTLFGPFQPKHISLLFEITIMPFQSIISTESGCPVILLKNTLTGCEAEIYGFGGILNAFRIPNHQKVQNVIEGFDSVQDAKDNLTNGFKSAKLSPFVCRMHKGQFTFGASEYTIQKHFLGVHAIHGLLYDAIYQIVETESEENKASVTLVHQYSGTDPGYPFPYTVRIKWQLEETDDEDIKGNQLTVTTHVSHENLQSIPLADGWHPYFTLGGSLDDYTIQFDSESQLEFNADLIPTGKKIPDTRFMNGCSLKGIELDNSFVLSPNVIQPKCVLQNDQLQLIVLPGSAYPILQIYIPNHRKSIAIENLSGAPDNFNNGMGLVLLRPGEVKIFETAYIVFGR